MKPAFLVVIVTDGCPGVGTFYDKADAEAFATRTGGTLLPIALALAAPALLSACESALCDAYDLMPDEDEDPVASQIRAAVQRANGDA